MSEKLKSCPFCGSEVISDGWVGCSNKDCDLAFSNFGVSIEVWNNRPGEAKARREALEWVRDIVIAIDVTTDVQGALNAILDKIEEKP